MTVESNEDGFDKAIAEWINRGKAFQEFLANLASYSAKSVAKAGVYWAFTHPYEAFFYGYMIKQTGWRGARFSGRILGTEIAQKLSWIKIGAEEAARGTRIQNPVYRLTGRSKSGMTLTQRLAARQARARALSAGVGLGGALLAFDLYTTMEKEYSDSINERAGLVPTMPEPVAPPEFIGGGNTF